MRKTHMELEYVFTPDPGPTIYASADTGQPNEVSLGVLISTGTSWPVTVARLEIEIPVGANDSSKLSPAPVLPAPAFDTQANPTLSITSAGSVVTIATNDGSNVTISSTRPLAFALPGIAVGPVPGVVPITITEVPARGAHREDKTHSLTKQQTTWPVTRFWAEPAALTGLDQTVTLRWSCNSLGEKYGYSLNAPGWQPRDCLEGGTCYDVQDGRQGITSLALTSTTEFTLMVVQAQGGNRSNVGTLNTTVQILQPKIGGKLPIVYFSGWVARLYWLATNASKCRVSLNGVTLDDNAPLDTWDKGYLVQAAVEGEQKLEVTAVAASGQVDVFTVPSFVTAKGQRVVTFPPDPNWPSVVGISSDGTVAMVDALVDDGGADYAVRVIDVGKRPIGPPDFVGVPQVEGLAIAPDGTLALTSTTYGLTTPFNVSVIDVAKRAVKPVSIAVGHFALAMAFTPDSKLALVANSEDNNVSVIDTSALDPHPPAVPCGQSPMAIAFTPDSKLALVGNFDGNTLTVIDLHPPRAARPTPVPVGGAPIAIAITPDGKLALVARQNNSEILVIDVPTLTARSSTIQVGQSPTNIAVTPDSQIALVGNGPNNTLTVIDLNALRPVRVTPIPIGTIPPWVLAITADGKTAVIVDHSGVVVL